MENLAEPLTKYYKAFFSFLLLSILVITVIVNIVLILNREIVFIVLMTLILIIELIGFYLLTRFNSKYADELYLNENCLVIVIGDKRTKINLNSVKHIHQVKNIVWGKTGTIKLEFEVNTEFGKWIIFYSAWRYKKSVYDYLLQKKMESQVTNLHQ